MNFIKSKKYNSMIDSYTFEIKHEKLLKFLGFRLFRIEEIDDYEFRMSKLIFRYSPKPMQASLKFRLNLPIPFMKRDHGLQVAKNKIPHAYESNDSNGYSRKIKHHSEIRLRFF